MKTLTKLLLAVALLINFACNNKNEEEQKSIEAPAPSCNASASGSIGKVQKPELIAELKDRWHESWSASPVVADIDQDGQNEIIVARSGLVLAWHLDGKIVFKAKTPKRIWASPVVADLVPSNQGLEIAVSSGNQIFVWDKNGNNISGFPVSWRGELRSLAAGDIDKDGEYELVAVTTKYLQANKRKDIIIAYNMNGSVVNGFPPNTTGTAGCDDKCYVTNGYDQNLAIGDVDNDGIDDIVATQDNAYISLHHGSGKAFDANKIFERATKFVGIRFLHNYERAKKGWSNDEDNQNQAHFTNSAPAIADINSDGVNELVVLGSSQNASQKDRKRGVSLWVLNHDGTRIKGWEKPFHAPDYLAGLWDYSGQNIVAACNQVSIADIDPSRQGAEMIFAGFDGKIHAVDTKKQEMWSYKYTNSDNVLTGGVLIADLNADGSPEIVFASYSTAPKRSHLFILDAGGNEKYKIPLPGRGAMPVPTIADVDGDKQLEIIVSLKDAEDKKRMVQVYTVKGSSTNCLLWFTGRANYLRNGYVPN